MRQDVGDSRETASSVVEELALHILMRDTGSRVWDNRRERSGLVLVVMGFLVKGGFSEESGLQRGCRDEETPAAKSRKEKGLEHPRRNMLIYGGRKAWIGLLNTSSMVVERDEGDKRRATRI